jgi:hypothetical protein
LGLSLNAFSKAQKVGKVSFFIGKPMIKKKSTKKLKAVRLNFSVYEGDRIQTAKAERLEIKLKDGSLIRIAEQSDVAILCPSMKVISSDVKKGRIWANIKKLGTRNYDFEVTTGTATAAIRGTVFRMDQSAKDSVTSVLVYDGKVDVGPGKKLQKTMKAPAPGERREIAGPTEVAGPYEVSLMEWVTIVKGMQINIKQDGKYHKFRFNQEKDNEDPWVKFNKERDQAVPVKQKK